MTERTLETIHHDVVELLPWFVNGTLGAEETARVKAHLAECVACRQTHEDVIALADAVNRPATIPIVPDADPSRLLQRLDQSERRRARSPFLIAAAIAVFAIGATFVVLDVARQSPAIYQTATSDDDRPVMDYVLDVRFVSSIGAERRDMILADIGAHRMAAETPADTYRVVVQIQATTMGELAVYREQLADRDGVLDVDVVALQLPVGGDP